MLYCPKCRGEFEDWAKTCPDCHLDLVAEPPSQPDEPPRLDSIRELRHSLGNPRALLLLAGATMVLALCGLVTYCVGTALGEDAGAWHVTQISLYSLSHAIYYPGVLLGLAVLAVPSLGGGPAGARRLFRVFVIGAIVVVLLGVGEAITNVNLYDFQSGWYTAGTVSSGLAGEVFRGGVLLGLGYLCLRRARTVESPEAPAEVPEP